MLLFNEVVNPNINPSFFSQNVHYFFICDFTACVEGKKGRDKIVETEANTHQGDGTAPSEHVPAALGTAFSHGQ